MDYKREDRSPPLARVKRVGKQQHRRSDGTDGRMEGVGLNKTRRNHLFSYWGGG